MDDAEARYMQENRHLAERLLVFLQRRRLLREHEAREDYEDCRRSADDLRRVFESEMLAVAGGGLLLEVLTDLQRACTNFVSAAGRNSERFFSDDELFRYQLRVLREVFAQRVGLVVDFFGLTVTPEIRAILEFDR